MIDDIEKQLEDLYIQEEIPQLTKRERRNLRHLTRKNKKHKPVNFFKYFALPVCCLLLMLTLAVPVYSHFKPNNPPAPPTIYYTDSEAISNDLDQAQAMAIVNENKSEYNFIFEDYTFLSSIGFYTEDNEILATFVKLEEKEFPFTTINLYIVYNNNFKLSSHDSYLTDAEFDEDYNLYKKIDTTGYKPTMKGYAKYLDFSIYLELIVANVELLSEELLYTFLI